MTKYKWLDNLIFVVAMVVAVLLLWVVAALAVDNTLVLPMPSGVVKELTTLLSTAEFYTQVGLTVARALAAFAFSLVVALFLALAAHMFPLRRAINALVTLLRALPTMSIIFLCIVLFPSRVICLVVTFLVAFPVMYAAFDSALNELKPLDDMCAVFGVNKLDKIRFVYVPYLPKHTFTQCRSTVALAVKVCIAGEALALPRLGIGVEMYVAKVNLDTAALLAWTVAALVCCYIIDGLFVLGKKLVSKVNSCRETKVDKNSMAVETADNACDFADTAKNNCDVVLSDIGVRFGNSVLYDGLDCCFKQGKVHVILGASGCGKTTLLNVVAGLVSHSGTVNGAKRCSYVFQDARLCCGTTVSDNVQLVLRGTVADKKRRNDIAEQMLSLAQLSDKSQRNVDTLSGGEAQRVSLARAFACNSDVLLADEPLKSLDLAVRRRLYVTLDEMLTACPRTVLYVTHDVEEAVMLADEIYIASGKPCNVTRVATIDVPRNKRNPWGAEEIALRKQLENCIADEQ